MNTKKSKNADLEGKRLGLLGLGMVVASSIVLMAFTFKTIKIEPLANKEKEIVDKFEEEVEVEILDIVPPPPPPPPPPPAATPPPEVLLEVEEVKNDVDVEEQDKVTEIPDGEKFEEEEEVVEEVVIFDVVGKDPAYPGGEAAMFNFINAKFEYPEMAREMGEQGTVFVRFVVYSDGSIKDVEVMKGVSKLIDKEAMRVIKLMPKWAPGEQAGKAVNVRYILPIKATIH